MITRDVKDIVSEYTSDYSKYVATNRAIPNLSDGLKPVQRRLVLSANDLGIYHNKKFLKVAKLTGQVLGDYHPHGGADPVGMAQWFTTRYPAFDGSGNFGSPDMPGSYAAERYIEIRLSEFAENFYLESVDYADKDDNYDGRLKEVTQFYPPIPGSLLTGAQGIAVGLSTNVPTYNIVDVCNSLLNYINGKDFLTIIPDTCEESIILTPREEIRKMYENGFGSINYKAKTHYETINGKLSLVVDAFPPGYSKKRLETSLIIDAVESGDLELVNESKEHIRYVFSSTRRDVLEEIEGRLTNSIGYRFNIDHKGIIRCYKLTDLYNDFIEDRKVYIVRKFSDLYNKSQHECSYYDILYKFKSNKDYIKGMLDKSSDEVIKDIIKMYNTTEDIAKRIINSSIRSLLKDNQKEILDKIKDLTDKSVLYKSYVDDPMKKIILDINDLKKLMLSLGDKRRALHVDDIKSEHKIKHRGKTVVIKNDKMYYLGTSDNNITVVKGSEINNLDDSICFCECGYEYYVLSDGYGICGMTEEGFRVGNKFKAEGLFEIIGTNALKTVSYKQGNKVKYLDDWCLRKRSSYIKLSEDKVNFNS